jgi:hypothetical protein
MSLVSYAVLGAATIYFNPEVPIDVVVIHREALDGLLNGENPYSLTYPDIYGPDHPYTVPGTSVNGRLISGFPYPPLSLLLALPGHWMAGDYRYSQLAANIVSALLIAYARPSTRSGMAAVMFLLTPTSLFILNMGWTEPFLVLLLACVVFCAIRGRRLLFVPLGLLFAVKQHTFLVALAVPLLANTWSGAATLLVRSGLVAVLAYTPFIVWDGTSLFRGVTATTFFANYFRMDSLSYSAWIASMTGVKLPRPIAGLACLGAAAFAFMRLPRTPAAFALAVSLIFLTFFALNGVSFCNHYFFVLGAAACSVGAMRTSGGRDGDVPSN